MPTQSDTFEFYNPWSTKNQRTTQPGITMPQMVNGRKPPPVLTLFSEKLPGASFYKLPERIHAVSYTISGAFRGTCTVQVSYTPNPIDVDWEDLLDTKVTYTGLETTGAAGIAGGFSGAVSRPTRTDQRNFTNTCTWVRIKLEISRGTLQSAKYNF